MFSRYSPYVYLILLLIISKVSETKRAASTIQLFGRQIPQAKYDEAQIQKISLNCVVQDHDIEETDHGIFGDVVLKVPSGESVADLRRTSEIIVANIDKLLNLYLNIRGLSSNYPVQFDDVTQKNNLIKIQFKVDCPVLDQETVALGLDSICRQSTFNIFLEKKTQKKKN